MDTREAQKNDKATLTLLHDSDSAKSTIFKKRLIPRLLSFI